MQERFNPMDYGFEFTNDGTAYGWYSFDSAAAHKAARKARDARARELRKAGRKVRCSANSGQLITRGGIGTGRPQIEEIVTVYRLAY